MWQRWNQSTHIFEKSTDNGASWTPLGLNGSIITEGTIADARLSSNVALKNINNDFSIPQSILQTVQLKDPGYPSFSIQNFQGYIRYINTAYGQVAYMDMGGNFTAAGSVGTGAAQISASGPVVANAGFYERTRSFKMGDRQSWTASLTTDAGSGISTSNNLCFYTVFGGGVVLASIYLGPFTIPAATAYIGISGPPGFLPGLPTWEFNTVRIYLGATGAEVGFLDIVQGIGIRAWRQNSSAWPAGGTNYILGQMFYFLA